MEVRNNDLFMNMLIKRKEKEAKHLHFNKLTCIVEREKKKGGYLNSFNMIINKISKLINTAKCQKWVFILKSII